jgi:hypothetical protein
MKNEMRPICRQSLYQRCWSSAFAGGASGGCSTRRARAPLRVRNLFEVGKIFDGLVPGREFEQTIDRLKDFRRAARQRLGDFERDVRGMSRFADRLPERCKCFGDGAGVFRGIGRFRSDARSRVRLIIDVVRDPFYGLGKLGDGDTGTGNLLDGMPRRFLDFANLRTDFLRCL